MDDLPYQTYKKGEVSLERYKPMGERFTYIPPEALGLTEEQEQEKMLFRGKATDKETWEHFTPEFVGTKSQEVSIDELREQIRIATQTYEESRISQFTGEIKIDTALPVAIAHFGDSHLGSIYTDTDEVFRKLKIIKDTPNMYVILMSNLIDNAIPSQFPNNMLANAIPPDRQVIMMRSLVEELDESGKVLAAVTSPCHEGWTYKHTGQDINQLIFGYEGRKFPILENGGRLNINLGGYVYKGALFHQVGPFESNFNETHALRQLNRLYSIGADWMAGAHRHVGAAEEVWEGVGQEHRILRVYIRSGSEKGTGKVHDKFSIDKYGKTGMPTGQTLHLWPGQRRLSATCDFDTAVMAHESYYVRELMYPSKPIMK